MNDTVGCPYCEYENDMSDGLIDLPSDNKFDHECSNCEEEFEVFVEFDPCYSSSKIEYVACEKCNRKTREPNVKGRIFPFPKSVIENVLCEECWKAGILADYERES